MANRGGPATAYEIARNGHIAALIRSELAKRQWTVADLCRAMGLDSKSTSVYPWIKGTSAPGANFRRMLVKAFGVEESELMPREVDAAPTPSALVPVSKVRVPPVALAAARSLAATGDLLAFTVGPDGTARLRLDVTLPTEQAVPLLRILLDAGFVAGRQP
jgi:transcriptional regulator with XRE-family HTH domain